MARRSCLVLLFGLTAFLCAAAVRSETQSQAAKNADRFLQNFEFEWAISAYTEAIRLSPKDAGLYAH